MEEYKFGDWVSGYKHSQNISVHVQQKTTTPMTTQQTSLSSKQTTTTTLQTTTNIHTVEDYEVTTDDIDVKIADDKSSHESIEHDDSIVDDDREINEDNVYDDNIEALPV
jgi:hypothetical protein